MFVAAQIGFIDEAFDENVYVLACVIDGAAGSCSPLRSLLLGKQQELKFGQEGHARKLLLAQAYARLGLQAVIAVKESKGSNERRRGLCLVALAWWVGDFVDSLVFDASQERGNIHDRTVLKGLSGHGPKLTASFMPSQDVETLWAADIVAGSMFHDVARGEPSYRHLLGDHHTLVEA